MIVADATWLLSAALAAVRVTEVDDEIVAGAVYSPVEPIVPTAGLIDQFTDVLLFPETVAVNC